MNKKYIYTGLLGLASLAFTGCTNLDEEVFSDLTQDNYYTDKASVIAALTRPYEHGHWCGWEGDRWILQELSADHFVWAQKGKHGYDGGQWIRMHEQTWTADEGVINGGWVGPFQGIQQCNLYIADFTGLDYVGMGMTEADKKQHIGEMRTLRSWFYLFLIDFFRNVPISTDIVTQVGQSTPQEVFAHVDAELDAALNDLPVNGVSGRWDQAGNRAIKVRLYLNAEKWIGKAMYEEAAAIAQEIIDGKYGTYALDADYRGPFRSGVNGYKSPENIFEFPHARKYLEMGWMYDACMHYQARYSLDNDKGGWNGITLTPSRDLKGDIYNYQMGKPYEKFVDGDYRKQQFKTTAKGGQYDGFFLIGQQYAFDYKNGFGYTDEKILGTEEWNKEPLNYVDQIGRFSEGANGLAKGSHVNTGEENSGVRFIKFPWLPESQSLFMMNYVAEVRLAEMYYVVAENAFRKGDVAKAAQYLDDVRKRNYPASIWAENSYVLNPSKLTEDEFVDELGREFLGERHRRTDLIRFNRFGNEWWDKKATTGKEIYPIPNRIVNSNPLIEQTTPGF